MLYKWQTHFFIQGAENYYGRPFPLLSLTHQPLLSRARTGSQDEIQVPISRLTHQSGKWEVGAPAASRQPLSLRGSVLDASFLYILRQFMSQNLVRKFWKSLFDFSTKGADQCPNCRRTIRAAPAGTHVPLLRQGPVCPGRADGGNPCPVRRAALQLQRRRGCQFLQHHLMLSLLSFY